MFGRVFTHAFHLRRSPQYEAQQRIIKEQDGGLHHWEDINTNPTWDDETERRILTKEKTDWMVEKEMARSASGDDIDGEQRKERTMRWRF